MDPRSPYLHHHRYASHPHRPHSQPQLQTHPRPHNNFHSNSNIHASHHSSIPSVTPLPLRPPPPMPHTQFHHAPAQPLFGQNSDTINYNHRRSHPGVPNFTESPRVLPQKPFDSDFSRRLQDNIRENRVESRNSPRVSDRWPPERPYSSANLNAESYRRQLVSQTMSPVKTRQVLEVNSRFLEERNVTMARQGEEFLMRRADDNHNRRFQFGSSSDRSSRDLRTASNQMNHGSSFDSSRGFPFNDQVSESKRWAHDREVTDDLRDSFIDRGSHEVSAPERVQISGKRENYRNREELERHNGKGSREGSFEYSRTPRKQPQKKSALLRLQKPNCRNREEERAQFYFDDSKSTALRVKDQNPYPDRGMEQKARQGSPVELDVSFKSNSLVAKAIVTPPSSSAAVSDMDVTPRSGKKRKVLFLNKDNSSSSSIKTSELTEMLDDAIPVAKDTSSSDVGLKQLKGEVIASGTDNLNKIPSVLASSGSKVSTGKSIIQNSAKNMASKKDETSSALAKTSFKIAKKKKNVKRLVKKAVHHNLSSSSSQPNKKCEGTIIPDGLAHDLPDSSKPENDVAIASANAFESQLCSNEVSPMPENDKVEVNCDAAASESRAEASSGRLCLANAEACTDRLCPPNDERKRSGSTSPTGSPIHEGIHVKENRLKADSADSMHVISNTDKDDKLPKENFSTEADDVEDVEKRQYQLDNSPNMLLQSKDYTECGSSSLEKIEVLEGQPSFYDMISGYGTEHDLISSREGVAVSENGVLDSGCKEKCLDQDSSVENGNQDEIANANFVGNSKTVEQSNPGDTTIQKVAIYPIISVEGVRTMSGSDNAHSLSEETNGVTNAKQLSPERVGMLVDNFVVSTGVSEEDTSSSKTSEENVETSKGNFLNSEVNESCLGTGDMVRSTSWVDTTLRLSFKECTGCSGDAGVQPCKDVVSVFPQESLNDLLKEFISPPKQKPDKLSGSELKLSCMIASDMNERPIISDISVISAEAPASSGGSQAGQDAEAREAAMDPSIISDFPPSQRDHITSLPNCSGGECRSTVDSIRDSFDNDDVRSVHSCSTTNELAVSKVQSSNSSGLVADQIEDVTAVLEGSSHQINSICLESAEGEKMDVDAAEGKFGFDPVTGQCEVPSETQSLKSDDRLLAANVENERCHHVKNDSSSVSKYTSSPRDGNGVSVAKSTIEVLVLVPGTLSDSDYVEAPPPSTLDRQISIEKVGMVDEILGQPAVQGFSNISPLASDPLNADISIISEHVVDKAHPFSVKTGTLPPVDCKNSSLTLNAAKEINERTNQPAQAVSRLSGSSSLAFATSKKAASSTPPSKPRTWHRNHNVSVLASPGNNVEQRQLSRNVSKFQSTSYIRKGNSLVRKPASAAQSSGLHNSNSLATDEAKKNTGMNNRAFAAEPLQFGRNTAGVSFEMSRTPPLPTAKPNHSSGSLGDCMASLAAESVNNIAAESSSGVIVVAESNDVVKSSEDAIKGLENPAGEFGQINNFDGHNDLNDRNTMLSNANSITYVKRKSNQLIATSNPHLSMNNSINTLAAPSDGYYKRRKHQLIRTSLEGQVELMASFPDGSLNSDEQALCNSASSKSFSKRQFRKFLTKTRKPSKLSLVWTPRSSQLSNGNGSLVHHQKIWPHLFPWKRATYLKNSVPSVTTSLISSSTSTMRKLLLSRKRDTVYTRSKHGFSLRKSKVLSVGGSSLKWSKSIERQSKKVNEEATLAVAEAERKKREQGVASHFVSGTKNSSTRKAVHNIKLHAGRQIFRIGSVCYKMDSSRRTLQRVSDDDSPYPAACQTEKGAKISYVPRRLVIGKDEYVRIGNGNQLVRDPKRRTRILASEKVRWSLHTARSRLARKRKYCQFYTRFGKCNKDDGKCHYIHDSSKIAVCTKFLNGLCSNADCKLTHKVIPERMPDCSFFLQGICSNENCPYRHVHVNPNASTCEGFLRGYCADGDECRKKHSYVCPAYEATGSCPQGSKCKLHHPKNRSKRKKIKQCRDKKNNSQGRYFGSMQNNVLESGTTVTRKLPLQDNGDARLEGNLADYISLDFSEEAGETGDPVDEEMYICDSDPMDFELVGLDDLIKPIRIMNG